MKTLGSFSLAVILVLISVPANAELVTSSAYPNMVYDSELDITFLKDANYANTSGFVQSNGSSSGFMIYNDALDFIDHLNDINYGGFSNWRLPSFEDDELGHLYHDDGISYWEPAPFINLGSYYWTDELNYDPADGREFSFLSGNYISFAAYRFVFPVHDGAPHIRRLMLYRPFYKQIFVLP